MNKKKLIGIAIGFLIIILGTIGYFSKQKYDSLLKATSQGIALGKTFGKMAYQDNCMMGLKMKYASCNSTECELSANGYIDGCMKTAKKDEFCDTVPNINDTKGSIDWVSKTCNENSLSTSKCLKYMHKFVSVCTEQIKNRKISSGELFQSGFKKGLQNNSE